MNSPGLFAWQGEVTAQKPKPRPMDLELAAQHSQWLRQLQAEIATLNQQFQQVCPPGQVPNDAQLAQLGVLGQQQYDQLLFRYGSAATRFEQAGFPTLKQTLEAELRDIQESMRIFQQMQADRKLHETQRWAIQRQTEAEVLRIQQEVHLNRQRMFDDYNRRWSENFNRPSGAFHYCPRCGRPVGPYAPCAFCPPC